MDSNAGPEASRPAQADFSRTPRTFGGRSRSVEGVWRCSWAPGLSTLHVRRAGTVCGGVYSGLLRVYPRFTFFCTDGRNVKDLASSFGDRLTCPCRPRALTKRPNGDTTRFRTDFPPKPRRRSTDGSAHSQFVVPQVPCKPSQAPRDVLQSG